VAGKADWFAAGLARQGARADSPRAGDLAQREVPTCSLTEQVGSVRERMRASGWQACVVVNERRVVLGVLREKAALGANPDLPVEQVMQPGPSTFRPDVPVEELADFLREHDRSQAWITTSDGVLVGLLLRSDLQGQ
jgi:Mg/Co/Ni transporter MgtE